MQAPKFLAYDTGAISALPNLMLLMVNLASCLRLPINRNSVLPSFSHRMSSLIQARTSRMQFSMAAAASTSLKLSDGLNEKYS